MIPSILDNDLYKFTMQQAVLRLYPEAEVRYRFTDRNHWSYPDGFAEALKRQVRNMQDLRLSREEKQFLKKRCPFLDSTYLDFLERYRFTPDEVVIDQSNGKLELSVQGNWVRTILWEVPLLAMISELYFQMTGQSGDEEQVRMAKAVEKARRLAAGHIEFSDFGTRRRFSRSNQEMVVDTLKAHSGSGFMGTSNVMLAYQQDLAPIGTMAHEWIMFQGAVFGYRNANARALKQWQAIYGSNLSIALSDTYTTEVFLHEFTGDLASRFNGVRQDSGDPLRFAGRMIDHYQQLGIDPALKTIVFSDSLDVDRVLEIHRFCKGRIRDVYGIGTHLSNDVGVKPLNIVIKLLQCKPDPGGAWRNAVKLSDDPGKHMGDGAAVQACLDEVNAFGSK